MLSRIGDLDDQSLQPTLRRDDRIFSLTIRTVAVAGSVFAMLMFTATSSGVRCCAQGLLGDEIGESRNLSGPLIQSDSFEAERFDPSQPIERFRRGFYQGSEVLGGYTFGLGDDDDDLDRGFGEYRIALGVPLGSLDRILAVQPFFRVDSIDGPSVIDVPDTLYQIGINLFNRQRWSERLSTTLIITPSIRSDLTTSENAFRLFGLGLITWKSSPRWSFSGGILYLDRSDLGLLPVIGATWTPREDLRVDFTLPRPRISKRVWKHGSQAEGWAFFGGELAGNTWGVSRADDTTDELTLGELRLVGGYETIVKGNRGVRVEGGYAFRRTIQYERDDIEIDLADGLFLQASLKF